ncbi:hypothetical protein CTI12_AA256810 [Artemisia annua]|uniref:Uncharacterized protein n=1 Tax=Artemisia annua TaxID=35608 RepID=A0A2U1NKA8_ARTAN|nr:hypothetical protein CTI12_AA256810 [Artemisia annua]
MSLDDCERHVSLTHTKWKHGHGNSQQIIQDISPKLRKAIRDIVIVGVALLGFAQLDLLCQDNKRHYGLVGRNRTGKTPFLRYMA